MNGKYGKLLNWSKNDLDGNLMKWWSENTIDEKNGGFFGIVRGDNTPDETADKFIVLNARLVWTFSACYEITKNPMYRELAGRAYEYFTSYFYDRKFGGFFTSVDYMGQPAAEHKFIYGNAFAIYGLSEYARVFGCDGAKKLAQETVKLLDANMWDIDNKGYYETASRDWQYTPNAVMMHRDPRNQKTMNTHLHLIEAYTNLLRIDGSGALRSRVRELLYIFLNKIVNRDNWHFNYFQTRDWAPTTPDMTFGHDIEGSWLLYETAEILGEPEALSDARGVCVNMARAVYDDGIAGSGALYTEYEPHNRRFTDDFSWWEQNEAVVGFLNAYQMTKEEKFLDASLAALDFIDRHFIDRALGGWYARVNHDGSPKTEVDKCNGFICPYHNARMSIEIIKRLQ